LDVALELGPGPFGGMSQVYEAGKWYLLDPLNETYINMVAVEDRHTRLQAYCEDIPIDDNSVDIVFSCNSLDHADNYVVCIDEVLRILKKPGLVCLLVDCRTKDQLNIGHRHAFSSIEIEHKFTDRGFKTLAKNEVKRENKPYLNLAVVFEKMLV
jgi:ubiquinone/menaquinone biosynthesis C-methylase UbiE